MATSLAVAHQVQTQDITLAPDGTQTFPQGVAADRRISVEDAEMRHSRKSRSLLVDGYKRHVLRDLESRLIVAVGVTPANVPEASVTDAIETDLAAQQSTLKELHIDRAYLASKLVQQRADDLTIFCKAWPVRQGPYFFQKRLPSGLGATRPAMFQVARPCPLPPGEVVKFPWPPRVRVVPCESAAPRAPRGAVSLFIPMKRCFKNCANASRRRRGGRSCASVWRWNMPWRTLGAGKADAPTTGECVRMCLICGAVLSCIIYMC